MNITLIIYADKKSLLDKIVTCYNNPRKPSTAKIYKHIGYGFKHCSFDATKNKHHYYRGRTCMKIFCKDLKEPAMKIREYGKENVIINK